MKFSQIKAFALTALSISSATAFSVSYSNTTSQSATSASTSSTATPWIRGYGENRTPRYAVYIPTELGPWTDIALISLDDETNYAFIPGSAGVFGGNDGAYVNLTSSFDLTDDSSSTECDVLVEGFSTDYDTIKIVTPSTKINNFGQTTFTSTFALSITYENSKSKSKRQDVVYYLVGTAILDSESFSSYLPSSSYVPSSSSSSSSLTTVTTTTKEEESTVSKTVTCTEEKCSPTAVTVTELECSAGTCSFVTSVEKITSTQATVLENVSTYAVVSTPIYQIWVPDSSSAASSAAASSVAALSTYEGSAPRSAVGGAIAGLFLFMGALLI